MPNCQVRQSALRGSGVSPVERPTCVHNASSSSGRDRVFHGEFILPVVATRTLHSCCLPAAAFDSISDEPARQRQFQAFQKGILPKHYRRPTSSDQMPLTPRITQLFQQCLSTCGRFTRCGKLRYPIPVDLYLDGFGVVPRPFQPASLCADTISSASAGTQLVKSERFGPHCKKCLCCERLPLFRCEPPA